MDRIDMVDSVESDGNRAWLDAFDLGYQDIELVYGIVQTNDETPEQDELREQHDRVKSGIAELDVELLRAYIDGMRGYLWDHLW